MIQIITKIEWHEDSFTNKSKREVDWRIPWIIRTYVCAYQIPLTIEPWQCFPWAFKYSVFSSIIKKHKEWYSLSSLTTLSTLLHKVSSKYFANAHGLWMDGFVDREGVVFQYNLRLFFLLHFLLPFLWVDFSSACIF